MNSWTPTFQTENARFQVERKFGVMVRACDLSHQHLGRGLYHELWRDHEWLYISRLAAADHGQVEIEYIELKSFAQQSSQAESTTELSEQRAIRQVLTFEPDEEVLISTQSMPRPQGTRMTTVTTRVTREEPLNDSDLLSFGPFHRLSFAKGPNMTPYGIAFSTSDTGVCIDAITSAKPFQDWLESMLCQNFSVHSVHIQAAEMLDGKVVFIRFTAALVDSNGKLIPGMLFMRGDEKTRFMYVIFPAGSLSW